MDEGKEKKTKATRAECRTFGRISDLTDGRRPGIIGSGHTERLPRRGLGALIFFVRRRS